MIEGLEGHSARHGAVTDYGAGFAPFPLAVRGDRHAERDAD